ncbi:MAG: hypothetical protein Q9220_003682 [cf. Caloplaca sp. 1 TL-2023]
MSGHTPETEANVLFCHQCDNEWQGRTTDLHCPRCDSEFVELVENNDDPRENPTASEDDEAHSDRPAHNPLHEINPWTRHGLDHPNIEHVEWNPGPGIHFSRTSYRSTSQQGALPAQRPTDIASLFQSMFDIQPTHMAPAGGPRPGGPFPTPFPPPHHNHQNSPWQTNPLPFPDPHRNQTGYGGRNTYTSTSRVWPSPNNQGNNHLEEVMRNLFENLGQMNNPNAPNGPGAGPRAGPGGFSGLQQLFASILNPANAAHGDAVYSQEALDRIITQFMETHNGSSAPGPASAAAISALPKKKVDKEMLGSDGKAECSVCMDNVELGDEVTILPCHHWFHGECVGAWLKEHDTCPHCRQGIMPKDGPANGGAATAPRSPSQEPMHSLPPLSAGPEGSSPGGVYFRYQSGGNRNNSPPIMSFRSQQDVRPSRMERRRSSGSRSSGGRNGGEGSSGGGGGGGGGISGAIGGWMRNHLGGGSSDRR